MLDKIKKLKNLVEITEDALERRQDNLSDLVHPIFAAATGWDRTPSCKDVRVPHNRDVVVITYQYRWDDCDEEFEIPKKIFEADDPVKAATAWRNRSNAQKKAKEKAARKKRLERELARLEAEDEMD